MRQATPDSPRIPGAGDATGARRSPLGASAAPLSRREFLQLGAGATAALAVPGCGLGGPDADAPPDVALVILDALRARSLAMYGCPRNTAPHLERLAEQSAVYRCASSATWTRPAVVGLFTGLPAELHGNTSIGRAIAPETPTLTRALSNAGYRTGYFPTNGVVGPALGMDPHVDHADYRGLRGHDGEAAIEACASWLSGLPEDTPAFAYVHFYPPHMPYDPPPRFVERARAEAKRAALSNGHLLPYHREVDAAASAFNIFGRIPTARDVIAHSVDPLEYQLLYEANVGYADWLTQQLLESWRRHRGDQRLVFVVTSDHGENFGEEGLFCSHGKILTNANLDVPLLVHDTADPIARRPQAPVSHLDLPNSILALAGAEERLGDIGVPVLAGAAPAVRPLLSSDRPMGVGVPKDVEPSWAVTEWPWRLVYNDAAQFGGHCVVDVVAADAPASLRSKRVFLPVPRTALRRPVALARDVVLEDLGLTTPYAEPAEGWAFAGQVRASDAARGRLALRARHPSGAVEELAPLTVAGDTELTGVLHGPPPTEAGEPPPVDRGAPPPIDRGVPPLVALEGRWQPEAGGGGDEAWRPLFSFPLFRSERLGDGLELVGAELDSHDVVPGDTVRARVVLRCLETFEAPPRLAFALSSETGDVVWRSTGTPFAALLTKPEAKVVPAQVLQRGHRFELPLWIVVPDTAKPGRYALRASQGEGAGLAAASLHVRADAASALAELAGREADAGELTVFARADDVALSRESASLARLSGRLVDEGHADYLLALGADSADSADRRARHLDRCLARVPSHRRGLELRGALPSELAPATACDLRFQDRLRLYGFDVARSEGDDSLLLTLHWEALAPMVEPYGVELRGAGDQRPFWFVGTGARSSQALRVGEALVERVRVPQPQAHDVLSARDLLARARTATVDWPGRPDWKRVEVADGRHLHVAAWAPGDPDATRIELPVSKGRHSLRADARLRPDASAGTRISLHLAQGGSSTPVAEVALAPGRAVPIDIPFETSRDDAVLEIRYRMAEGAATADRSNAVLSNLELRVARDRSARSLRLALRVYPYWAFAYAGYGARGDLAVRDASGRRLRVAELGRFAWGELPVDATDWLARKRSNPAFHQLYDLASDPDETTNLLARKPEVFARLQPRLATLVERAEVEGSGGRSSDVDLPEDLVDELRAIGYIQ